MRARLPACNASTPVVTLGVTPKSHRRYTLLPGNPAESPFCSAVTLKTQKLIYIRTYI